MTLGAMALLFITIGFCAAMGHFMWVASNRMLEWDRKRAEKQAVQTIERRTAWPDQADQENYEWETVETLGGGIEHFPVRCLHKRTVPVELSTGEVVAFLCLACDEQLPGE